MTIRMHVIILPQGRDQCGLIKIHDWEHVWPGIFLLPSPRTPWLTPDHFGGHG